MVQVLVEKMNQKMCDAGNRKAKCPYKKNFEDLWMACVGPGMDGEKNLSWWEEGKLERRRRVKRRDWPWEKKLQKRKEEEEKHRKWRRYDQNWRWQSWNISIPASIKFHRRRRGMLPNKRPGRNSERIKLTLWTLLNLTKEWEGRNKWQMFVEKICRKKK